MMEIRSIDEIEVGDRIVVPFTRQIEAMEWMPIMTVKEVGESELLFEETIYDYAPDDPSEIVVWNVE